MRRSVLTAKRALFAGRMVVFYCDLNGREISATSCPGTLRVKRINALAELSAEDLQEMTIFWNPKLANRNIRERFERGASLWLIKSEHRLAGYGWTLQGRTIEPYYFPLAEDDVHLFDFHVFHQYRGQGINPYLVRQILGSLATTRGGRAFIEVAEWNDAQLSSLRKTPFRCLGSVRSFAILGHTIMSWNENSAVRGKHESVESVDRTLSAAKYE